MPHDEARADSPPPPAPGGTTGRLLRIGLGLVALVALVWLGRQLGGYVPRFAAWVEGLGIWGPVVFVAGYALATVGFIPGSLLTLAAGAIFGLVEGTALVFVGALLGSTAAFLVGRYVARSAVERRISGNRRFHVIDRAIGREGLKIVFLLRLSPVFPYNLLNYALGLTSVGTRDYILASLGMLPGTFLYVYLGKAAGDLAQALSGARPEGGSGRWIVLGLGLAATVVVTTIVTRIARKALDEEVES